MMATTRQEAVREISNAAPDMRETSSASSPRLQDYFGSLVFDDDVQRQRLPMSVYRALRSTIESGTELPAEVADAVASAMRDWAIEHGATHYTHWFQPMTGLTAEKHDSFLQVGPEGRAILEFSGSQLVRGEPDASSFPSGGLRATFEARGYTAWDPTSPAFLRMNAGGATLTIPTAFCSWTGEALDKKTPLLRSCEAVSKAAVRLLGLLGESNVRRVTPTTGAEQEYFLIDRQFYALRPDIVSCGRTLFGARPPKGQELEDHYFGAISQRILTFMMNLERELWKLGIPIKTRHNEVAPSQFELAPIFQGVSVSTDQNMLTMDVLKEVAERHGMYALLHEKPFAGVNGSGKHLNWSLADDHGNNLLEPGQTPHENLKFILFLTAILRAVDLHQDLLRASIASAGNDHRLGANEAPPAIISVFVGTPLEEVVDALIEGRPPKAHGASGVLKLGVNTLPTLPRDISDRNRTSPFAFTGNKFEFRAVASSQSVAYPATFLNMIVAESLDHLSEQIEQRGGATSETLQAVVREALRQHRRILFGGDNYSEEWQAEAARRGLLNRRATPEALMDFASEENVALFSRYGVLSRQEAESRFRVMTGKYAHCINVEALAAMDIARTMILPAGMAYQQRLSESIAAVMRVSEVAVTGQKELLGEVTGIIERLKTATDELARVQHELEESDLQEGPLAAAYHDRVLPAMLRVRTEADRLEVLCDDDLWPLPKYRELLFIH